MRNILVLILLTFAASSLWANNNIPIPQDTIPHYIQFSGVVVTGDSLHKVPFSHIYVKGTNRGTSADYYGFFSFVAKPGETLVFSSVGFKNSYYKIPDTLSGKRYNWIQMLQNDTILLQETVIYPWPTIEDLKMAIVALEMPEGDYERAIKNLEMEKLKEMAMYMPMGGNMNYQNQIQKMVDRNYYNGQYMPNNLLNPFAWAKFIEAWKKGDFKKKK